MQQFGQACKEGNTDYVLSFLDRGGDPNEVINGWHERALHLAASRGNLSVIPVLLEYGADTEARDYRGQTPLSVAAWWGNTEACKLLLAGGAVVDAQDNRGATPLWYAARNGHHQVVELLLKHGASTVSAESDDGSGPLSPLEAGVLSGDRRTCRSLIQAGMDPDGSDESFWSPLTLAVQREMPDMVELLLSLGADPGRPDPGGRYPRKLAEESKDGIMLRLLEDEWAEISPSAAQAFTGRLLSHGRIALWIAPVTRLGRENYESDSPMDKRLEGILSSIIFSSGDYTLLNREDIDAYAREMEWQLSGFGSEDEGAGIGKLLGAEFILVPELLYQETGIFLAVKLYDLERAATAGTALVELDNPPDLRESARKAMEEAGLLTRGL